MEPQNIQERETQQVSPKIELQIKTIQNDLIVLENKQEFLLEQNSNIVALLSKFKSERKRKRQRTQMFGKSSVPNGRNAAFNNEMK